MTNLLTPLTERDIQEIEKNVPWFWYQSCEDAARECIGDAGIQELAREYQGGSEAASRAYLNGQTFITDFEGGVLVRAFDKILDGAREKYAKIA